ncbi:MAG: CHAT domain-containing protein [Planctomycetota bacterium]|nr:CHAT domain-containing protein [Planctomycetota bacterium]
MSVAALRFLAEGVLATAQLAFRKAKSFGHISTEGFNILHIVGHGQFDSESEEGAVIFEDDRGSLFPLGVRSIREICCKRGISMVFLNTCQSGSGGQHNFNKGVAQALVSHGVPAVVANQYSVLDTSATSFAQHFYWALANGMSIGQAACEARIAVNCALHGEIIDWAVPVVYARDPNMSLCAKPAHIVPMASMAVRAESHRAIRGRRLRVAVWDIDSIFPSLQHTLERMNDARTVFGFELVALSAPIDAWDLEDRAEDGTPYLWTEKLADRLQHFTVELGVNVLGCVTRHWMSDDNFLNIYGWWPPGQQPPVMIFSSAGFDDLPPAGDDTDRAIANLMVEGLTGFLGNVDSHSDKIAPNCPLGFVPKVSIESVRQVLSDEGECQHAAEVFGCLLEA